MSNARKVEQAKAKAADTITRVKAIDGSVSSSLEAAKEELRRTLTKKTGLKAGDSAEDRLKKIWDTMDSIGDTTSCRPWKPFVNQVCRKGGEGGEGGCCAPMA